MSQFPYTYVRLEQSDTIELIKNNCALIKIKIYRQSQYTSNQKIYLISIEVMDQMERCDNCMKDYPEYKMPTHYGYCRRNIKKCNICQEMIDINYRQEHEDEFHTKQKCTHCLESFHSNYFRQHQQKCKYKPKFCKYCQLNVPVIGFQTHFKACQSHTKLCFNCDRHIMNKNYQVHSFDCNRIIQTVPQPTKYQQNIFYRQQREQSVKSRKGMNKITQKQKLYEKEGKQKNKYVGTIQRRNVQQKTIYKQITYPSQRQINSSSNLDKKINVQKNIQKNSAQANIINKRQQQKTNGQKYQKFNYNEINKQSQKYVQSQRKNNEQKYVESKDFSKKQQSLKGKQFDKNLNHKIQQTKGGYDLKNKVPMVQQKYYSSHTQSPITKNEYLVHQLTFAQLGISPEQQMLQEILMQSVSKQKNKKVRLNPEYTSYSVSKSNQILQVEAQDLMNKSFIQKQRAIEQQIASKNKRRR